MMIKNIPTAADAKDGMVGNSCGSCMGTLSQSGLYSELSQYRNSTSAMAEVCARLYAMPFESKRKEEILASGGLYRAVISNSR